MSIINLLMALSQQSKAEIVARKRIEDANSKHPSIQVASDLHLCEMLLADIDKLREKQPTTSVLARWHRAEDLLTKLIDKIGESPVLEPIYKDALKIRRILQGLEDEIS